MQSRFAPVFAALLFVVIGGCGGSGGSGAQPVTQPTMIASSSTPTPAATLGVTTRFDWQGNPLAAPDAAAVAAYARDPLSTATLEGLDKIPSNFDRLTEIVKSQSPALESGDPLGAFRMTCQSGQVNSDDPIVYPGVVRGSPHLHQWFGNTEANALSTFHSLRTTGLSTCNGPLNRSAYWIPAMYRGDGKIVRPDYLTVYYKRYPESAAECTTTAKACLALPRGLRYVFGYDMKRMGEAQTENLIFIWKCVTPQNTTLGNTGRRIADITCPPGNLMIVTLAAPDCWDGVNLDSANHRSHMAYQQYGQSGGPPKCPASHPYLIPQFTLGAAYSIEADEDVQNWYLSSDRMPGMMQMDAGSTFHSDWFGAWDDETAATWLANCINRKLSCSAGQLGDGTVMKLLANWSLKSPPRVLDPANSTAGN